MGNIIVKDPNCKNNLQVIYFGQDLEGKHKGTLYLIHNTIITPFAGPILMISAGDAKIDLEGNLICDGGIGNGEQVVAKSIAPATVKNITGMFNVFGRRFKGSGSTNLSSSDNFFEQPLESPFVDSVAHNYRPNRELPRGWPRNVIMFPKFPDLKGERQQPLIWQYKYPRGKEECPF